MQMKIFNQSLPLWGVKVIIADRTDINVCLRISEIIEFYNFFASDARWGSVESVWHFKLAKAFYSHTQILAPRHLQTTLYTSHSFCAAKSPMSLFVVCRRAFSRDEKYLSSQPSWTSVVECVWVQMQKASNLWAILYFQFAAPAIMEWNEDVHNWK